MAEYLIQDTTLDAIADAINAKTGESSAMTPAEMVTAIGSIETGESDTVNHVQYVQAENWGSVGAGGNTRNFYNTYLNDIPRGAMFSAYITNNTFTGAGKAILACGTKKSPSRTAFWRSSVADSLTTDNYDFFISAGSIIDVYYVVLP